MALGLTVDLNMSVVHIAQQVDRAIGQFNRLQQSTEAISSKISKAFKALGVGFSAAGVVYFAKSLIDAADALDEMSSRTGVAVEKLAGLQLLATQTGTDLDALAASLNKFSVNLAKNREGYAALGISAKDPYEAILQLARVMDSIDDPQKRALMGATALGKAWAQWQPIFDLGYVAIKKMVDEAAELSKINAKSAKEAGEFNDAMDKLLKTIEGLSFQALGPLIHDLTILVDGLVNATAWAGNLKDSLSKLSNIKIGPFDIDIMGGLDLNPLAKAEKMLVGFTDHLNKLKSDKTYQPKIDLADMDGKIAKTQKNLTELQKGGFTIGKLLNPGGTKGIENEQVKLNGLLEKRNKIAKDLNEIQWDLKNKDKGPPPPSNDAIDKFLKLLHNEPKGGGGSRRGGGGGGGKSDEQKQLEQLQGAYNNLFNSLTKEIALRDKNSEAAKTEYEILNGNLKGLAPAQAERLMNLAKEKDALEVQAKKWDALVESANAYYDIKKSNADLIKYGGIQEGFNDALAKTQDAFNAPGSSMNTAQLKAEYTKLAQAYNDEFIKPAKEGTDELSQFGIQAARNIQTSFADFLFDPFKDGVSGMLDNFMIAIRRMAAEMAAQLVMEQLIGKPGTKGDTGGALGSLVDWLGTLGSAAGSSGAMGGGGTFSAKGNVFNQGALVKYASGGVFSSSMFNYGDSSNSVNYGDTIHKRGGDVISQPTYFPMAQGKTGLMGEAGPEAIMPLIRLPDGKLGVKSVSSVINHFVNTQETIHGKSDASILNQSYVYNYGDNVHVIHNAPVNLPHTSIVYRNPIESVVKNNLTTEKRIKTAQASPVRISIPAVIVPHAKISSSSVINQAPVYTYGDTNNSIANDHIQSEISNAVSKLETYNQTANNFSESTLNNKTESFGGAVNHLSSVNSIASNDQSSNISNQSTVNNRTKNQAAAMPQAVKFASGGVINQGSTVNKSGDSFSQSSIVNYGDSVKQSPGLITIPAVEQLTSIPLQFAAGAVFNRGNHYSDTYNQGQIIRFAAGGVFPQSNTYNFGNTASNISHSTLSHFAAGGVFSQPTTFPITDHKIGMLGEAGPEAIMPLKRGADGKLGINAGARAPVNITVNVHGNTSAPDVRRSAAQGAREGAALIGGFSRYR